MKRKKQQEEHGKNETNIDFDSLLKLASNLTQQEGLLSQWSQTAGTGEANDVDLSSIITDISKACSHTFAGLEEKLNEVIAELKTLNEKLDCLQHTKKTDN
ncbi:hypothetical protein [Halobacillus aidingensis]|uniref:Uncharacterized protein n=1 Tax=Halobacillus aidingensis TaxID=240303 RepID=A0A1H0G5V0_HALAD|nr:hypothetical protein [Halobacillus aidingensis]SDO02277.1 hypothetical protein SAMN05421677_102231 [Halobacillus aidingensis]